MGVQRMTAKEYYAANRERLKREQRRRYAENHEYRERSLARARVYYYAHRDQYLERSRSPRHRKMQVEYRRKVRREVLSHYSDGTLCCACCGWRSGSEMERLEIDHVNGGGRKHRLRVIGSVGGTRFFEWLRSHDYPDGFRVLCAGCNKMMVPGKAHCLLHGGAQT